MWMKLLVPQQTSLLSSTAITKDRERDTQTNIRTCSVFISFVSIWLWTPNFTLQNFITNNQGQNSCRQRHSTPEESLVFELFNDCHVSFLAKQNSGRELLLVFFYFTNFERNEAKYIFSRYKPRLKALFLFSVFHGVFNNNNRVLKCSTILLL